MSIDSNYIRVAFVKCDMCKHIKLLMRDGVPVVEVGGMLDIPPRWIELELDANGIVDLIRGLQKQLAILSGADRNN